MAILIRNFYGKDFIRLVSKRGCFCAAKTSFSTFSASTEPSLMLDGTLRLKPPVPIQCIRWKSKKNRQLNADEDLSDDSDNEGDLLVGKGTEVKKCVVGSMRMDLLLKTGLGLARNKVEEAFYESKVRINSKKVSKKSTHVMIGDEVDIIKGVSPANPKFINVGRMEILSAKPRDGGESIEVKFRKSKLLTIDNYPDGDPWKQSESGGA